LASDTLHLRAAQLALAAGDAQRASDEAARVSPSSPLAEERDGVRVLAACALNKAGKTAQAARDAEAFAAAYPRSSLLPRIRSDCR